MLIRKVNKSWHSIQLRVVVLNVTAPIKYSLQIFLNIVTDAAQNLLKFFEREKIGNFLYLNLA